MTDKLEDTSLRLKDEMDLYRKMMDKLRQNRQQFQKEKEAMQEVGGILLWNQTFVNTRIRVGFVLLLTLLPLSLLHSSFVLQLGQVTHLHPQDTALTLHNIIHLSFLFV